MKLAPLALIAALASPAAAFDISSMSEAERAAFRAEVRAYLLENPEVLSEAIEVLQQRQAEEAASQDLNLVKANQQDLFQDSHSYVGGNPEGDITVVEFIDYRCGYCRKAHTEVGQLIESDGDIRYIVKEFPILGDQSVIAARFAIATLQVAGAEAYEKVNAGFYTFRGDVSVETRPLQAASTPNRYRPYGRARSDQGDRGKPPAALQILARRPSSRCCAAYAPLGASHCQERG